MTAKDHSEKSLGDKISDIRLLVVDLDGVLTDGTVQIDVNGKSSKSVNYLDRDSIEEWRETYKFAIVTGGSGHLQKAIAEFVGYDAIRYTARDKAEGLRSVCEELGVSLEETCYVGDANRDAPAIALAGVGMTTINASKACHEASDKLVYRKGGHGCVHEVVETLLGRI